MKVAILGFGIEGRDAAGYFLKKKADVTVFDKKPEDELDISSFNVAQITWVCGEDYLKNGIAGFDIIVRSPGIRADIPEILEALKDGANLTSCTKIFFDECKTPIIGVTGTKGKGTTASLIYEGLKACGKKVLLLGNIGEPLLSALDSTLNVDYVVLELSSFQTIDLHKSPHIVVVTNITVDHLDWHKDEDEYHQAKKQLWTNQTKQDYLIVNADDSISMKLSDGAPGNVQTYTGENDKANELMIPGKHNLYNANAALLAITLTGSDSVKAWKGISSFEGLEHRLEKIAEVGGVTYINDSYATNPEPTIAAIHSFEQAKILILGGSSKGADFSKLSEEITNNNVLGVVLIGDEAENIKSRLKLSNYKGINKDGGKTMEEIVKVAKSLAKPGNVVLLSPACASFGLFKDYKDRGKQFKKQVLKLNA